MSNLDQDLIRAHQANDLDKLVELYQQAADDSFGRNDIDAGCFYLTHAYIFALECNHPNACLIHSRLVYYGREMGS